jgi:hypothetical protein
MTKLILILVSLPKTLVPSFGRALGLCHPHVFLRKCYHLNNRPELTNLGFRPMTQQAIDKLKEFKGLVVEDLPEEK